ncbi:MAG: xanthine dehydrogenase family protein molybdopterin-binding subunit [Thermomicrobiales bacterium]
MTAEPGKRTDVVQPADHDQPHDLPAAGRLSPLVGRVLGGPHAHARIARIDGWRAKALPGVVAVLISDDVLDTDPYHGLFVEDRPLMAIDRTRFVGEPVAAVAAEDPTVAAHARTLIDVTYEELPAAPTLDAALADGAPRLHLTELLRPGILHGPTDWTGHRGNVCWRQRAATGDVAAAFAGADLIVAGEYDIARGAPAPVVPPPIVADWTDSSLTIWTASPEPFLPRAKLARIFDLPLDRVRIIVTPGCDPGARNDGLSVAPIAAALARKAKRPVRLEASPGESPLTAAWPGARVGMRTAATAAGRLLAREVRVDLDLGAFAGDHPLRIDPAPVLGPYRWQAVAFEAQGVYTNTPPNTASSPLLPAIGELQVDEIARRLGRDALEVRTQNLLASIVSSPASTLVRRS